jgi:hypothetical protein
MKSIIEPVFDTLTTILNITKGVLDLAKNLLIDLTDPNTLAIKGFIEAVRAVLEDLTGEGGAGVFFIPIPIIPIDKELADKVLYPEPGKNDMNAAEAFETALREGRVGSGGNYGFLDTLRASMYDPKDPMRPQLDEDAHVAGLVFYFGTESYLKLVSLIFKLAQLFSDKDQTSGVADALTGGAIDLPRPKNLKAELVPSSTTNAVKETLENRLTGDSDTPMAVRLTWDLEDRVHVTPWPTIDSYGKVTIQLEEVVVYRSDKPIPTTMSLSQRSEFAIARYPFSGWVSEFYDESINKNNTYYYAVGYKIVEQDPEDADKTYETMGNDPLAIANTQITVPEDTNMFSRRGTPPDWFMFPSPLALIPSVTNAVRKIEAAIDAIEKTIDDKFAKTKKYIDGIGDLIDYYTNLIEDIVGTIKQFIDALNWTGVYAGVMGFSGKGGNLRVIKEVGDALFDTEDPDRPPFDIGTEAVCGFVLMAGAESYGKLEKFIALSELLWGMNIERASDVGDAAANAWEAALDSIDAAEAEIRERICLAEDFAHLIDCQEEELATMTFANNMQPDDGDAECTGN